MNHECAFAMCVHYLNDVALWHAACGDDHPGNHFDYDRKLRVVRCDNCETAGRSYEWCQTNPAPHELPMMTMRIMMPSEFFAELATDINPTEAVYWMYDPDEWLDYVQ